jgi:ribosomal protein S18 acetylase RimI-like enzyme
MKPAVAALHSMQVRPFDPSFDQALYVNGYCASFRESYPGVPVTDALQTSYRESLANLETTPGLRALTAQSEAGQPAGFVVLAINEMDAVRHVSIDAIYVNDRFRGEGVARLLLAHAAQHAREVGAIATRLEVSVANKAALALYETEGYVVTRYQMERHAA